MSDDYYEMQCREREAKFQRLETWIECGDFASLSKESVRDVIKMMSCVVQERYPNNNPIYKMWDRCDSDECCECDKMWNWSDFDQFAVTCILEDRRNDLQWFLDEGLVRWNNILSAGEALQQPWVIDMALETMMDLDDATVSWDCRDIPAMEAVPKFATTTSDGVYAVLVKHGLTPIDQRRLYRGVMTLTL